HGAVAPDAVRGLIGAGIVVSVARSFGIRHWRLIDLVVAIVFARAFLILFCHEGRSPRHVRTRTSRRRHGARRREGDRAEARRGGGTRPLERAGPGPAAAARGRPADSDPHNEGQRRPGRTLRSAALVCAPPRRGSPTPLPRADG